MMSRHLLGSVLALTLGKGQGADSLWKELSAEHPPRFAVALEDATATAINTSISGRTVWDGVRYGAYVEKVPLHRCEHYATEYAPHFYGGSVINTRAMKTSGNERWTSAALINWDGVPISSTLGALPNVTSQLTYTWEMLYHSAAWQDIRFDAPPVLRLNLWNFFPQIYIPLYLEDIETGKAYMLHLYPERSFLEVTSSYEFVNGVLWARGEGNQERLFHVDIDIAGLIRNIDNFEVPNYKDFIYTHGQYYSLKNYGQNDAGYGPKRQIYIEGPRNGSATDYICQTGSPTMDITWEEMQSILQREMRWL